MENELLELLAKQSNSTENLNRDTSKTYHKITISVNQYEKEAIHRYATSNNVKVSALIKALLKEKGII